MEHYKKRPFMKDSWKPSHWRKITLAPNLAGVWLVGRTQMCIKLNVVHQILLVVLACRQPRDESLPCLDNRQLVLLLTEVYGLVTGPSWWRRSLLEVMTKQLGYVLNPYDKCVLTLPSESTRADASTEGFIVVEVDDLAEAGGPKHKKKMKELEGLLKFGKIEELYGNKDGSNYAGRHIQRLNDCSFEHHMDEYIYTRLKPVKLSRKVLKKDDHQVKLDEREKTQLRDLSRRMMRRQQLQFWLQHFQILLWLRSLLETMWWDIWSFFRFDWKFTLSRKQISKIFWSLILLLILLAKKSFNLDGSWDSPIRRWIRELKHQQVWCNGDRRECVAKRRHQWCVKALQCQLQLVPLHVKMLSCIAFISRTIHRD